MEVVSADPYELKLFHMFKSCDTQNSGHLDIEALRRLCGLLELRDKGAVLIADLAPAANSASASDGGGSVGQSAAPRVCFERFKEALLAFLGTELDGSATTKTASPAPLTAMEEGPSERSLVICDDIVHIYNIESPPESSDREVSPKLVVGTKKYGRRSRPQTHVAAAAINNDVTRSDDSDNSDDDDNVAPKESDHRMCSVTLNCNHKLVQRSTSQTDIPGSRRRRPFGAFNGGSKLKRCSSLPAQRNMQSLAKFSTSSVQSTAVKPQLLTTNKSTQASQDNTAATQLHSSIESLGFENVLRRTPLHQDFCGKASSTASAFVLSVGSEAGLYLSELFKDTPTQLETLPAQSIIEIWESASIASGKGILLALGFQEDEVNLSQLNKVLEEELRSLDEEQQTTLLRASLALQSAELSAIRLSFRQLHAENAKLRSDNKDTNRRIAVQAVEIDERHAALEESSKNEIRLLEQKHAGVVRDLTARMTNDREHWSNLTSQLEARLKTYEQDDIKIKTEMDLIHTENIDLETERQKLHNQITELLEKNIQLNRELAEQSTRSDEGSGSRAANDDDDNDDKTSTDLEVLRLAGKLCTLQEENTNLRDKNDELVVEMENLNLELTRAKAKSKKASVTNSTFLLETDDEVEAGASASIATKRRGDSPSKTQGNIEEESPRLGKLRKYAQNESGGVAEAGETSGEWVPLNSELQHSEQASSTPKEKRDQSEQSSSSRAAKNFAEERCKELETSLEQMQRAYEDCEDYWQSKLSEERQLSEKERQLYEEEQQESDKKFTELMEKVREYEEQFSKDGRLSPIVEKDALEEQYADLEAELETTQCDAEEKSKTIEALQSEIKELREILTGANELNNEAEQRTSGIGATDVPSSASSPISYLWHQSTIQEPAKNYQKFDEEESATAASSLASKQNRSINLSTSETTIFSTTPVETAASAQSSHSTISPIQKPGGGSSSRPKSVDGDVADCETSSTGSGKSFETHSVASTTPSVQKRLQTTQSTNTQNPTKTYSSQENSCSSPSGIKEELKRLKFFEISLKEQIKDLSLQRDGLVMELQQLHEARPVLEKAYARTTHPTLIQRVNQLELKNRHLQNVIKQQQQYTEGLLNRSWHQHKIELGDLHSRIETQGIMLAEQVQRLQNADILVKDLYVENSHLTATVQRLEQQRARVNMMHQQQQMQQQQRQLSLSGLPGMP